MFSSSTGLGLVAGQATSAVMAHLPMSLIPTFAVPFLVILHLVSLLQLRTRWASGRDQPTGAYA